MAPVEPDAGSVVKVSITKKPILILTPVECVQVNVSNAPTTLNILALLV